MNRSSINQGPQSNNYMLWATRLLVSVVWLSALLFGLYIFIFYFVGALQGNMDNWNEALSNLYERDTQMATISIGAHFAAGSLILMLGCIQLMDSVRIKYPTIHRYLGRLYVLLSLITAIGGLTFIMIKGTVGGLFMDIGFAGYGVLTFIAAIATIYYARSRDFGLHRAWAIRLFALAIGSWLYRMDYGFWFMFTDGLGHTNQFSGPFDMFMNFFFYVPNLIVAEVIIGRYDILKGSIAKGLAILSMYVASAFLILATYFFTTKFWWPAMMEVIGAS